MSELSASPSSFDRPLLYGLVRSLRRSLALAFILGQQSAMASPPPVNLDEGVRPSITSEAPSPLWIPPDRRAQWRALLNAPQEGRALIALHYGDSHTQGSFLTRALRDELARPRALGLLQEPSPGFVHQGHPHRWAGVVELSGHWLRQNWIYGRDQGPFGPLGISFVTQDRHAAATLMLDNPPQDQDALVTLFYAEEAQRLGFCVRVLSDEDQASRATKRQEELTEALARYEARFLLPAPPSAEASPAEVETDLMRGRPPEERALVSQQEGALGEPTSPAQDVITPAASRDSAQRALLQELLSERGHCVLADSDPQVSVTGEPQLKTLTLPLPPRHLLRLSVTNGELITDRIVKRWRAKRKRARRGRRGQRAAQGPSLRPDLVKADKARLRVLGYHVRYPSAQIEWSALGVRGARVKSAATRHQGSIQALATLAQPNLNVLWFGTNSAASTAVNLARYEEQFRSLIQQLKSSAPQAQCLLITPPDFGRRDPECFLNRQELSALKRRHKTAWTRQLLSEHRAARVCDPDQLLNLRKTGRHRYPVPGVTTQEGWERYRERCSFKTPALIAQLTEIQRRVAQEEGCALYDTLRAMGGEGSIQRWACVEPHWAQLDLIHLSVGGYEALGAHIARSLRHELGLDELPPPPLTPPQLLEQADVAQ